MDTASRTGNYGSIPSIIDASARQAGQAQSTNTIDQQLANQQAKLQQQQQGAAGLGALSSQDQTGALNAMGISTNDINAFSTAQKDQNEEMWNNINGAVGLGGKVLGGIGSMLVPGAEASGILSGLGGALGGKG